MNEKFIRFVDDISCGLENNFIFAPYCMCISCYLTETRFELLSHYHYLEITMN